MAVSDIRFVNTLAYNVHVFTLIRPPVRNKSRYAAFRKTPGKAPRGRRRPSSMNGSCKNVTIMGLEPKIYFQLRVVPRAADVSRAAM